MKIKIESIVLGPTDSLPPEKPHLSYAQGDPLGPPLSEWTFSPKTQERLRRYEEKYPKPTAAIPVEDEELFCTCVGVDDGSEMVECTNGTACLHQWFHTRCIRMRYLPADHGRWHPRLVCQYLGLADAETRRLVLSTLYKSQDWQACR